MDWLLLALKWLVMAIAVSPIALGIGLAVVEVSILPRLVPREEIEAMSTMPRKSNRRHPKVHSPVPVQAPRPAKKQGPVTVEDVELLVRWLLDTHRYTPWFRMLSYSTFPTCSPRLC